jgi:hypothetical protein
MKLLHQLKDEAAGLGSVTRASFFAGTLSELSVGPCRANFLMYCASVGLLSGVSSRGFRAGPAAPTLGHGRRHRIVQAPALLPVSCPRS